MWTGCGLLVKAYSASALNWSDPFVIVGSFLGLRSYVFGMSPAIKFPHRIEGFRVAILPLQQRKPVLRAQREAETARRVAYIVFRFAAWRVARLVHGVSFAGQTPGLGALVCEWIPDRHIRALAADAGEDDVAYGIMDVVLVVVSVDETDVNQGLAGVAE